MTGLVLSSDVIDFGGPYSFIENVDSVSIVPLNGNFTNCRTNDPLPEGLLLDRLTCNISGIPTRSTQSLSIHVKAENARGVVEIAVQACTMNAFEVLRTYAHSCALFETFLVYDAETDVVLLNITKDTPKKAPSVVSYRFCLPTNYLRVIVSSIVYDTWYPGSKIDVYSILPGSLRKDHLMSGRMDNPAGLPTTYYVAVNYLLSYNSEWKYSMDNLPTDWEMSTGETWQTGTAHTFPSSTRQIQVYKRTFLNTFEDRFGVAELNLYYPYGCLILLNGREVFREHIPQTPVSNETVATISQPATSSHHVLIRTVFHHEDVWESFLLEGMNTLTVVLFGPDPTTGFHASFDSMMRFTGEVSQFRSFSMVASSEGLEGNAAFVLDRDHETFIEMHGECNSEASITIQFNDSRHEAISRITLTSFFHHFIPGPTGFTLYARENDKQAWTQIQHVSNILWTNTSQTHQFWFQSSRLYNSFRFTQFEGVDGECEWRLGEIAFYTDNFARPITPLAYPPLTTFAHLILDPILPTTKDFSYFVISPELPDGLRMDSLTGRVDGRFPAPQNVTYLMFARAFNGKEFIVPWNVLVKSCDNGFSFYTLTVTTPKHAEPTYFELFHGLSNQGERMFQSDDLLEGPNNFTFCLADDYYTWTFTETTGAGWQYPSGYTLATHLDSFNVVTGTLERWAPLIHYSNASLTMWTGQPIQPRASLWHILANEVPKGDWRAIAFDDQNWLVDTTQRIPRLDLHTPTLFLRRHFTLTNPSRFSAFAVEVQFTGGVAIYFNGLRVFAYNLPIAWTPADNATDDHPFEKYSRFTLPLLALEVHEGDNVFAVELHHYERSEQSTNFDCLIQPLLNTTIAEVFSLEALNATEPHPRSLGPADSLFDMDSASLFRPEWHNGTFVDWTLESNQQPITGYGLYSAYTTVNHTWVLKGRLEGEEEWILLDRQAHVVLEDRIRTYFPLPKGLAGFKEFRYEVEDQEQTTAYNLMEIFLYYRAPRPDHDRMCPTLPGQYLAVESGETSYARCPANYAGVASRTCKKGKWQKEDRSTCRLLPPSNLHYPSSFPQRLPTRAMFHSPAPTVNGLVEHFSITPALPQGLKLTNKGAIQGLTKIAVSTQRYTITASNKAGHVSTVIILTIYDRFCEATKECPRSPMGTVCRIPCALENPSLIGIHKRKCMAMDEEVGVWSVRKGWCVSQGTAIVLVCIVIIALLVILIFSIQSIRRIRRTFQQRVIEKSENNVQPLLV